jgi:homogentisate 1,2-dioxygenase
MPVYHKLGTFPQKTRNLKTSFITNNFGTEGFRNSALLYHVHRPTQVKILKSHSVEPKIAIGKNKSLLLKGFDLKAEDDFLDSRKALLVNKDCTIGLAAPQKSLRDYFLKCGC